MRENQIAEITRGETLPLPPLAETHLTIIMDLILQAWGDIAASHAATLATGTEAEINALMEARLNTLLREDEPWSQLVFCAARGKESLSYDGTHLEKRPDISLFLTRGNPSFPLTVECKILEGESGKSVNLYCGNGLARYLSGEYGWSAVDGLMIAYVRDGSTTPATLRPFLEQTYSFIDDPYATAELPEPMDHFGTDASTSVHNRQFNYVDAVGGHAPGPISILHIWLIV